MYLKTVYILAELRMNGPSAVRGKYGFNYTFWWRSFSFPVDYQ